MFILIPAAGAGRRMGCAGSKQFLDLAGRPVVAHTLELFQRQPLVTAIRLVVAPEEIDFCQREIVARYGFDKVRSVCAGGAERQDSVRLGLEGFPASDEALVLIHDGARPLFDPALIPLLAAAVARSGAAIVAVPVKDTVKQVQAGVVVDTPDRRRLWLAQTPQAFRAGLIREAHRRATLDGFVGTDDASLLERLGHGVEIVPGSYRNLKITTPEDLLVARALLAAREE